jgi:hypothetical protein
MNRSGGRQIDPRKIAGYAFVVGMVLAPFFAAIYGWNVGLAVMALALGATAYLALDALRVADESVRGRLRLLLGINIVLCLICLGAFLVRVAD